jgi:hypothetical protein
MCLIMIGAMFVGFHYSRAAGFFTMAIFGDVAFGARRLRRVWLNPIGACINPPSLARRDS